MNRVAERVKNGGVFLRDSRIELPDIRFRDDHVFRECAIAIYADNLHVLADVGFAGAALQALAASDVHFGGNKIAFPNAGDFVTEGDHFSAEFVARNQRRMDAVLRPAVPIVDVEIGTADGRRLDFDQHVGAPEAGDLNFTNLSTRRCLRLDDRQHGFRHKRTPN